MRVTRSSAARAAIVMLRHAHARGSGWASLASGGAGVEVGVKPLSPRPLRGEEGAAMLTGSGRMKCQVGDGLRWWWELERLTGDHQ